MDIVAVAAVDDFNFLQHLANNHLNVLIVDQHALKTIDFLHLVNEVRCQRFHAFNRKNVMRRRVAVDDVIALINHVAILQMERF